MLDLEKLKAHPRPERPWFVHREHDAWVEIREGHGPGRMVGDCLSPMDAALAVDAVAALPELIAEVEQLRAVEARKDADLLAALNDLEQGVSAQATEALKLVTARAEAAEKRAQEAEAEAAEQGLRAEGLQESVTELESDRDSWRVDANRFENELAVEITAREAAEKERDALKAERGQLLNALREIGAIPCLWEDTGFSKIHRADACGACLARRALSGEAAR